MTVAKATDIEYVYYLVDDTLTIPRLVSVPRCSSLHSRPYGQCSRAHIRSSVVARSVCRRVEFGAARASYITLSLEGSTYTLNRTKRPLDAMDSYACRDCLF